MPQDFWTVAIIEDMKNRLTIKLPKEANDLELLPGIGDVVVMFGSGRLLEIWRKTEWVQSAKKAHPFILTEGLPLSDDV